MELGAWSKNDCSLLPPPCSPLFSTRGRSCTFTVHVLSVATPAFGLPARAPCKESNLLPSAYKAAALPFELTGQIDRAARPAGTKTQCDSRGRGAAGQSENDSRFQRTDAGKRPRRNTPQRPVPRATTATSARVERTIVAKFGILFRAILPSCLAAEGCGPPPAIPVLPTRAWVDRSNWNRVLSSSRARTVDRSVE